VDELERSLRELLTDERLDVPVRPGAVGAVHDGVRRRRAATRAVMAVSAVVAVLLGAGAVVAGSGLSHKAKVALGGDDDPTGTTSPPAEVSPSPTISKPAPPQRIAWDPRPYDGPAFLAVDTTPCRPDQLTLSLGEWQGATGAVAGPILATNNGTGCRLDGIPSVVGLSADGSPIAYQQPPQGEAVTATVQLHPGETALAVLVINGDAARCLGPVDRLQVGVAGDADTPLEVRWVDGGGVTPRCGTAAEDQQEDHYTVSSAGWELDSQAKESAEPLLSATMRRSSTTAQQGTVLHYQLMVDKDAAGGRPCTPFRQELVQQDGTVAATEAYLLPCPAIRQATSDQVVLDMQLLVPVDTPVGLLRLEWQTPDGQPVAAAVHVTAAPPPCQQDQLHITGHANGGAGSLYGRVILANVSDTDCSLYGYPGIEFVSASGQHLPTTAHLRYGPRVNVALQPGDRTSFIVVTPLSGHPSGSKPCRDVSGIDVIAPGLTQQVLVQDVATYCLDGAIDVSPVRQGTHWTP
jgi:hypothetical protein